MGSKALPIDRAVFLYSVVRPAKPFSGSILPACLRMPNSEKEMQYTLPIETDDLRKSPIEDSPASLSAYGRPVAPSKATADLPVGTQARFIEVAAIGADMGAPINTLLTIRWDSLFSGNVYNLLRPLTTPLRIDWFVELFRKWLKWRELPAAYIWVREVKNSEGEHWHIAFHLPKRLHPEIIEFVAKQTGEAAGPHLRPSHKRSEGEFACGEIGSWHLASDTRPQRQGFYLAAYLGKAEPSEVLFRGKMVPNKKKQVRGIQFGGAEEDGKYDARQGVIIGTACRRDRFFIAKFLQKRAKAKRRRTTPRPVPGKHTMLQKKDSPLSANKLFNRTCLICPLRAIYFTSEWLQPRVFRAECSLWRLASKNGKPALPLRISLPDESNKKQPWSDCVRKSL